MKNILVIGSRDSGAKNDPSVIAEHLSGEDITTKLAHWEELVFSIRTGTVTITADGQDLFAERPDLVVALGWYKNGKRAAYRDVAFSLALVLRKAGIPFWNSEMGEQRSTTKLSCMVQLALEAVPVPETYFSLTPSLTATVLDRPFIAKAISASRGNLNFLVDSDEKADEAVWSDAYLLIQPFLPNDHDLRVICFGGTPRLALRRSRTDDSTHLNNTSQGGAAAWVELAELDARILTESEKISKIMGREMAGIDFIPDGTSPFGYSCLEVNAIPQLTSGTDIDKKLTAFAQAVRE